MNVILSLKIPIWTFLRFTTFIFVNFTSPPIHPHNGAGHIERWLLWWWHWRGRLGGRTGQTVHLQSQTSLEESHQRQTRETAPQAQRHGSVEDKDGIKEGQNRGVRKARWVFTFSIWLYTANEMLREYSEVCLAWSMTVTSECFPAAGATIQVNTNILFCGGTSKYISA